MRRAPGAGGCRAGPQLCWDACGSRAALREGNKERKGGRAERVKRKLKEKKKREIKREKEERIREEK